MIQFITEFIVESIEYLEQIINPHPPPLNFAAIEMKKHQFNSQEGDMDVLQTSLNQMEEAFRNLGNLSFWTPELLDKIDDCFIGNYMEEGKPVPSFFFPNSTENLNKFMTYCSKVD